MKSCQMYTGRKAKSIAYASRLLSLTNDHLLTVHMLLDPRTQSYIMVIAGYLPYTEAIVLSESVMA